MSIDNCLNRISSWPREQVQRLSTPLPSEGRVLEIVTRIAICALFTISVVGLVYLLYNACCAPRLETKRISSEETGLLGANPIGSDDLRKRAVAEALGIERRYDAILLDPKKIPLPEGTQLLEDVQQFRTLYADLIRDPNNTKLSSIEAIEKGIKYLRTLSCALLMRQELSVDKSGEIAVLADGNCLYYSTLAGLQLVGAEKSSLTHMQLREQVNDWLIQHQAEPNIAAFLLEALESYQASQKESFGLDKISCEGVLKNWQEYGISLAERNASQQRLQEIQQQITAIEALTIPLYLKLARQNKFFGTIAEVHALSQLCNVTIHVKFLVRNALWNTMNFNPGKAKEITIRYKVDLSHFDAQGFEPQQASVAASATPGSGSSPKI